MKICRIYDDYESRELIYSGAGKPIMVELGETGEVTEIGDDYELPESLEDAINFALDCAGPAGWKIEWYV